MAFVRWAVFRFFKNHPSVRKHFFGDFFAICAGRQCNTMASPWATDRVSVDLEAGEGLSEFPLRPPATWTPTSSVTSTSASAAAARILRHNKTLDAANSAQTHQDGNFRAGYVNACPPNRPQSASWPCCCRRRYSASAPLRCLLLSNGHEIRHNLTRVGKIS